MKTRSAGATAQRGAADGRRRRCAQLPRLRRHPRLLPGRICRLRLPFRTGTTISSRLALQPLFHPFSPPAWPPSWTAAAVLVAAVGCQQQDNEGINLNLRQSYDIKFEALTHSDTLFLISGGLVIFPPSRTHSPFAGVWAAAAAGASPRGKGPTGGLIRLFPADTFAHLRRCSGRGCARRRSGRQMSWRRRWCRHLATAACCPTSTWCCAFPLVICGFLFNAPTLCPARLGSMLGTTGRHEDYVSMAPVHHYAAIHYCGVVRASTAHTRS